MDEITAQPAPTGDEAAAAKPKPPADERDPARALVPAHEARRPAPTIASGVRLWQSVKCTNPQHPCHGRAGSVQGVDPADPARILVRFDGDKDADWQNAADLERL